MERIEKPSDIIIVSRLVVLVFAQLCSCILKTIAVIQVAETGDSVKIRLCDEKGGPSRVPALERTSAKVQVVTTVQTEHLCHCHFGAKFLCRVMG